MTINNNNLKTSLSSLNSDFDGDTAQDIANFAYTFDKDNDSDKDNGDDPFGGIESFSASDLNKFCNEMGLSKEEKAILKDILNAELGEHIWDGSQRTSDGDLAKIATSVYDDTVSELPAGIELLDYSSSKETSTSVKNAGLALQNKINATDNGLQMKLLENASTDEIIISFRGTDQATDWNTNFRKGKQQYEAIQKELSDYVKAVNEAYSDKKITFTGHSLGGGLSEIAGYFAQKENPDADISVVSFNGFGGESTIKAIEGKENFDEEVLKNLDSTLYRTDNDPVSPLGTHITNNEIELETDTWRPIKDHSMGVVNEYFDGIKQNS